MISNLTKLSCLLIGTSFPMRLHTPIAFGATLGLGILLIIFENKNLIRLSIRNALSNKVFPILLIFFSFFSISTLFSIATFRSLLVEIYLFIFMFISYILFQFFKKNFTALKLTINFCLIGISFSTFLVFLFSIQNTLGLGIPTTLESTIIGFEIQKYKGFVNLLTILVLICPFLEKFLDHKRFVISFLLLILLIPTILISNCTSALLGIIVGFLGLFYIKILELFKSRKLKSLLTILLLTSTSTTFLNLLPKNTFQINPDEIRFNIPTSAIDAHRQIIWGFSYQKMKERLFFGFGADSSNFISDSQKIIGHSQTGTMRFIPSHPHNFFIELVLEIGLLGTFSFLLLILYVNYLNFINFEFSKYLVFFNFYFWGSSLVNFSFWTGWWQGSYFLILSLLLSITNKYIK